MTTEQMPEVTRLVQASYVRPLTDAERLRLAALTWTTDATFENARVLRDRHPSLFARLPTDTTAPLPEYEKKRVAVAAAGRLVAGPTAEYLAAIDAAAVEFESASAVRVDVRPHRAAFAAAVRTTGIGREAMGAWWAWQDAITDQEANTSRIADAQAHLGLPVGGGPGESRPQFLHEVGRALGDASGLDR